MKRICIVYQSKYYNLYDQIEARKKEKDGFFTEPELWYLVYSIVESLRTLEKSPAKMVGVKPENISISENG